MPHMPGLLQRPLGHEGISGFRDRVAERTAMMGLRQIALNELSKDVQAFLDWSARYAHATRQKGQTEAARLPDDSAGSEN